MSNKVSIKELIECIELNSGQLDEFEAYQNYINVETGEIVSVPAKFLTMVEDGEEPNRIEEWQIGDFEIAEDIIENNEKYSDIPNEEYIKEFDIMKDFCYSYKDKEISTELSNSINGRGAFRRFKQLIYDKGIDDEWYEYRDNKFCEKVIQWCQRNDIMYINDVK